MKKLLMFVSCIVVLDNSISSMEMERVKHRNRSDSETAVASKMEAIDLEAGKNNDPVVMSLSGGSAVPQLNLKDLDLQKQELDALVDAALEAKFGPDHNLPEKYRYTFRQQLREMHESPNEEHRQALARIKQISTDRKNRSVSKRTETPNGQKDDTKNANQIDPLDTLNVNSIRAIIHKATKDKLFIAIAGAAATGGASLLVALFTHYFGPGASCPLGNSTGI